MVNHKLLIIFIFLLGGCSTIQQLNTNTVYRKDMEIRVDGIKMRGGVYVLDKRQKYDIKAYFFKKADKFVVTTCHRHMVWSNPGDDISFTYEPDPQLEQSEDNLCPLECGAFDSSGQHSWCYIDFRSTETLVGRLSCNGEINRLVYGVSICQSKTHLAQRIVFDVPVSFVSSEDCPEPETTDKKTFIIEVGRNKCFYLFQAGQDFHRLTTFGYDDVILR